MPSWNVPNSGVALAVSEIARQRNKLFLASGAGTAELTGAKCNANTIHWTYDTWNLSQWNWKGHRQDRRQHLVLSDSRLYLRLRP